MDEVDTQLRVESNEGSVIVTIGTNRLDWVHNTHLIFINDNQIPFDPLVEISNETSRMKL